MAAKRNFKFSEEMLNAIDSRDDMEEDKREEQNIPEIKSDKEIWDEIHKKQKELAEVAASLDEKNENNVTEEETEEVSVEKPKRTRRKSSKSDENTKKSAKGKQMSFKIDADLVDGLMKNLKYGDSLSAEINRQIRCYQIQNGILKNK